MKKNKKNLLIIFILSILVLYLSFKDDFATKVKYLISFDFKWLILAFILIIMYWILKGLVLYYCTQKLKKEYTKKKGIHLMITTQFFHAITPFSTGGQPWQIYKLKKEGLTLGESTNIVIEDFIVYQIALVFLGVVAVISNKLFNILPKNNALGHLVTIGFIINLLVIVGLFIVAFSKKWNKKIIDGLVKILYKLRIIKDKEKLLKKSESFITNFHKSAEILFESKTNFIKIIFLNFIALILLYLIPYALIKGLNIDINPFKVVVTSAYVMLVGSMVPIPGGTGGLEYSFVSFFGSFIKGSKLSIIMIVWRLITYYFGITVGIITLNINKEAIK
ncbi:MAG: flippase-like domain-containing protein [Bacilli bacterium]|nr:flippase-like domain-containing protein [Bacilli bacterium]